MRLKVKTRAEKAAKTRKRNQKRARLGLRVREVVKPDWVTLRPQILAKTEGHCYLCWKVLSEEEMTTDHVVIEKMGARKNDATDNLMPACAECNWFKGSRRLIPGKVCGCGQKYLVQGLKCLRCLRVGIEGLKVCN